tara:strand:- start:566 stop:934 length:369 start_codon:yes stop_codon:yes gene_type:complete
MDKYSIEVEDALHQSVNGTSLKGYVSTTYDKLVELFGKPSHTDADPYEKVNMEWILNIKKYFIDEDGEEDWDYISATIYNWKTGSVPTDEYEWHIGGHNYEATDAIQYIISNNIKAEYNYND